MVIYSIVINKEAQKKLTKMPETRRLALLEAIKFLGLSPEDKRLDIKRLSGKHAIYRVRVGSWRIIFSRDELLKVIAIEKIGPRGGVYK